MANVGNSQPPISQESEEHPTPQETINPSPNGPTPNEPVQTPTADTNDNVEVTPQTGANRLKSVVWQHFTKTKVNGEDKAQCNYCKKLLGGKAKNGTKHLHQHMEICVQRKISMRGKKGQTFLMPKVIQGKQELGTGAYDAENARKELANAIILHEYPLSIVDHFGFKRYSAALQPLFQVPSRNTIKKEIFKVYDFERSIALKLLDSLEGRVAITLDMWTSSNQKRGYMAVTAHYIDSAWTLNSRILR